MSNRIRLLDETVINRIAAGEVVERPASVVKELLDNAVDAEASRIVVEVERGGKSSIRVADDGCGMSRDDALLSIERSATSKIRTADDLAQVGTLGFRGEALASIAAVSKFRLQTREADSQVGTELIMDGGKLRAVRETGCPVGTMVEVRSLFFHVPARRKFLRADATEWAHVEQTTRLAALARPQVGFTLVHDGREVWRADPVSGRIERIAQIFGREWMRAMLPVEAQNGAWRLSGVIGQPGISRSSRQEHLVFVNGRPITSSVLNFAILEGYHNSLMKGRFPVLVLALDLPPELVDVNVHPAKREVRFRDNAQVRDFVTTAIRQTLEGNARTVQVSLPTPPSPKTPERSATKPAQEGITSAVSAAGQGALFQDHDSGRPQRAAEVLPISRRLSNDLRSEPNPVGPERNHDLHVLGVLMNLYIIAETAEGIVMIDQHAAHERVMFEQMLTRVAREEAFSQRLLLPVPVDLTPEEAAFVRSNLEGLRAMGLDVGELGGNTFVVDGLPPMIKTGEVETFFRDVLADLRAEGGKTRGERRLSEEVIAKTVCRHAVKANDPLRPAEIERLLIDLHACDLPYTCPHGRPTMILISREELEKKFGRAV
ncbi:MAG: DNA mismatch repair endonuclease MutL [Candidatus Methylacidiphilales bacterium]